MNIKLLTLNILQKIITISKFINWTATDEQDSDTKQNKRSSETTDHNITIRLSTTDHKITMTEPTTVKLAPTIAFSQRSFTRVLNGDQHVILIWTQNSFIEYYYLIDLHLKSTHVIAYTLHDCNSKLSIVTVHKELTFITENEQ